MAEREGERRNKGGGREVDRKNLHVDDDKNNKSTRLKSLTFAGTKCVLHTINNLLSPLCNHISICLPKKPSTSLCRIGSS